MNSMFIILQILENGYCRIFDKIDTNKDGSLITDEVRVALVVLELNHQLPEGVVSNFMKYFDKDRSNGISLNEFEEGLMKWCKDVKLKNGLHQRGYVVSLKSWV